MKVPAQPIMQPQLTASRRHVISTTGLRRWGAPAATLAVPPPGLMPHLVQGLGLLPFLSSRSRGCSLSLRRRLLLRLRLRSRGSFSSRPPLPRSRSLRSSRRSRRSPSRRSPSRRSPSRRSPSRRSPSRRSPSRRDRPSSPRSLPRSSPGLPPLPEPLPYLHGPMGWPVRNSANFMLTRAEGLFEAARCCDSSMMSLFKSQPSLARSEKTLTSRAAAASSRLCSRAITEMRVSMLPAPEATGAPRGSPPPIPIICDVMT
mmetsp:Transcript_125288/g.279523  ORF Transcript_125288/g.279523 Transcript_125288/m.279523 type:complete len:259 (+) Transcript_125288:100-876(+)